MLQGRENGSESASGVRIDTHNGPWKRRRYSLSDVDLTSNRLGVLGTVRTEYQLRAFEGFAPGEVSPRDDTPQLDRSVHGGKTVCRITPQAWTEARGRPCDPSLGDFDTRADLLAWHDRWDARTDEAAREACAGCPVKAACLLAATEEERGLEHRQRYLVRGGLTPKGRWLLEQEASGHAP